MKRIYVTIEGRTELFCECKARFVDAILASLPYPLAYVEVA